MLTLERYLLREVLRPLLLVLGGLVVVFAGYSATEFLGQAASGVLRPEVVAGLVGLKVLIALEVLLPVALYLTVVFALSRLGRRRELSAMAACGFGPHRIVLALAPVFVAVAIASGFLSLAVRPWAYAASYRLKAHAEGTFDVGDLEAGEFYETPDGRHTIYIEKIEKDGDELANVFVWRERTDEPPLLVVAKRSIRADGGDGGSVFKLEGLRAYEMEGADPAVMSSDEVTVDLDFAIAKPIGYKRKAAPTSRLMKSKRPEDVAELQWRLTRPLSTILLGLLATMLSWGVRRSDRWLRWFLAIFLFAAYYHVSVMARTWVQQGWTGSFPGMWWVDVLFAAALGTALVREYRRAAG